MDAHAKSSSTANSPASAGLLDLARLGQMALRHWWLPALGLALGLAAAVFYLSKTPRVYTATAVLQVAQEPHDIVKFRDSDDGEDYRSPDVVKTFEQVLTSGSLLLRVVKANHLDADPRFAPPKRDGVPYLESELVDRLAGKVFVAIRRGTRLIDINVEDGDPIMACQLAGSVVEQFRQFDLDEKLKTSRATTDFLATEELRLKSNLNESEKKLAQYRTDNQAVSLEEKQNIVVAKLRELSDKVTEAKSKRLALEGDISRINKDGDALPEQLLELTSISTAPAVAELIRQINAADAAFAAIKQRYMYKHSKYIEAQYTLEKLKAARDAEITNAAASINRSYQAARENEAKLETALHDQEQAALTLDRMAIPYNSLLRQAETDRNLYESVLTRVKENSLSKGANSNSGLREVQAPTVPYRASKPSRSKVLALGALAGLLAGCAMILAIEFFNHTLQTVDQAEGVLGLPLLAGVPELRLRHRGKPGAPPLVGPADAAQREAFRTLRTTLAMFKARETRSFLFTSAVPGEGKSFCSLNFASTLASQGCHTLLVAADLRLVNDYATLLASREKPGLSECLVGPLPLAQAVHATNVQNLFLCPAGERAGDPAGLLAGPRFAEVLHQALQVFDRVVIDTPPINAVADALLMTPHADAVCLVVRARSTPVSAILRACRILARAGIVPAGFIFNRLSLRLGYKSAYYYYGKGYHDPAPTRTEPSPERH